MVIIQPQEMALRWSPDPARNGTLAGCDVILVNADGRVVEKGNHNELMALKGVYYKLQMQSQKWALKQTALMMWFGETSRSLFLMVDSVRYATR